MRSPFTIMLYDKAFTQLGPVGSVKALTVTVRHNQQSTAQLLVDVTHPRFQDLMTVGTRAVVRYNGAHLLGGPVRGRRGEGPRKTAYATFDILDDWFLFARTLAWPTPGADLASQTSEYDVWTGPAESVLKAIVSANAGRGTPALTVAGDLARGSTITVANRFHPITDRTIPLVDGAGIGTTVTQSGTGLVMDCYATRVYPRTLSEASGVVQEYKFNQDDGDATRVVVGGKGEGTARVFTPVVDTVLEARLGYSIETFKDATDTDADSDRVQRGTQALVEAAPSTGISVTLSETAAFRYDPTGLNGVRVGDVIPLDVGNGVIVTDVLRSCTLSLSVDEGLTVTPQVGDITTTAQKSARLLAALARAYRNLAGR